MKTRHFSLIWILISGCCLLSSGLFAQGWHLSYTQAEGNTLNSVCFVNADTGYACGNIGTIIKTYDGGLTWSTLSCNGNSSFNSVYFLSTDTGYVAGLMNIITGNPYTGFEVTASYGLVLMTKNGGASWDTILAVDSTELNAVYFMNADTGFAAGNNGHILRTIDGGINWTLEFSSYNSDDLYSICFLNPDTGYIAGGKIGTNDGILLKTSNCGNTWSVISSGVLPEFVSVYFINVDTGFAAISTGSLLRTTNGGNTWVPKITGNNSWMLKSVLFTDQNHGFAVGGSIDEGLIFSTIDGGLNWSSDTLFNWCFLSSCTVNPGHVYITGLRGTILKTVDNGISWDTVSHSEGNFLQSVFFPTPQRGYIASSGVILKTYDAGMNWETMYVPSDKWIYSVFFTDAEHGTAAGENGIIITTDDGGDHWILRNSGTTNSLFTLSFPTQDTGYAAGWYGTILKTTDGGQSWNQIWSDSSIWIITAIQFINGHTGFLSGRNDCLRTDDGGLTWSSIDPGGFYYKSSIFFLNSDTGFVATEFERSIYKTMDGGITWSQKVLPVSPAQPGIANIFFTDEQNGFAVGGYDDMEINDPHRLILKTSDGGDSWTEQFCFNCGLNSTNLTSVYFTSTTTGYAVGYYGTLLKTTDGGLSWAENVIESLKIFPNPTSGIVNITGLPASSQVQAINSTGQTLKKLEFKGQETLSFTLPESGIYFIRIISGNEVTTKKVVVCR